MSDPDAKGCLQDHTTLSARFASRRLGMQWSGRGHRRGENEHCGIMIHISQTALGLVYLRYWILGHLYF